MPMTTRGQSSTLVHLAARAYGRDLWLPRFVNRRQSQPPLGCSVQERRKQRVKISPYVSTSQGNHLVNYNHNSCGNSPPPVSSCPPGHSSLRPHCNSVSRRCSFPFHDGFQSFQPPLERCIISSVSYFLPNNRLAFELTSSFRFYG